MEAPLQAHPEATKPASGPTVPWTSGLVGAQAVPVDAQEQVSAQGGTLRTPSPRPFPAVPACRGLVTAIPLWLTAC